MWETEFAPHIQLIVWMSPTRLSLGELLPSRARLRFTRRLEHTAQFSSCQLVLDAMHARRA